MRPISCNPDVPEQIICCESNLLDDAYGCSVKVLISSPGVRESMHDAILNAYQVVNPGVSLKVLQRLNPIAAVSAKHLQRVTIGNNNKLRVFNADLNCTSFYPIKEGRPLTSI